MCVKMKKLVVGNAAFSYCDKIASLFSGLGPGFPAEE